MVQTTLCTVLKICHFSLNAASLACKSGEALVDLMSENIPNIEQSSITLIHMLPSEGTSACVKVSVSSSENVAAPMAVKAASGIAKKSLRIIGTAAVSISIIMDFVSIVENVKALDSRKLSDIVATLEKVASEMEDEMKKYDEVFATPSSVQNSLFKDMRCTPLYNCISK